MKTIRLVFSEKYFTSMDLVLQIENEQRLFVSNLLEMLDKFIKTKLFVLIEHCVFLLSYKI